MIDFQISPHGDLLFEEYESPQDFKLSFRLAKTQGLNLKFQTTEQVIHEHSVPLKVSFVTKQKTRKSHGSSLVLDQEEKIQRIKIALETERGELPLRENTGSRLSTVRHGDLFVQDNLRYIEDYVKESLRSVLPDPEVRAKPERGIGHFYPQTVGINIYENGILIFKFFI